MDEACEAVVLREHAMLGEDPVIDVLLQMRLRVLDLAEEARHCRACAALVLGGMLEAALEWVLRAVKNSRQRDETPLLPDHTIYEMDDDETDDDEEDDA
jgi:hypothetical protein